MTHPIDPTGETSNHKLAAVFDDRADAEEATRAVAAETSLAADQLAVVDADAAQTNRKLLPESHGIWRTLIRSHVVLGAVGALTGIGLFVSLYMLGARFVTDNPLLAAMVFVHVLTLFGLMVGGLTTIRPDQVPYVRVARKALREGHVVVLVHAQSGSELSAARDVLKQPALKAVRTA